MRWFILLSFIALFFSACGNGTTSGSKYDNYINALTAVTWQYDGEAMIAEAKAGGISNRELNQLNGIVNRLRASKWVFKKDGVVEIAELGALQGGKWDLNLRQNTLAITVYGTAKTPPFPIRELSPNRIILDDPRPEDQGGSLRFARIFKPVPNATEAPVQ